MAESRMRDIKDRKSIRERRTTGLKEELLASKINESRVIRKMSKDNESFVRTMKFEDIEMKRLRRSQLR